MSEISATCSNGHSVLGIPNGTACPECGDTFRQVSITVTDTAAIDVQDAVAGLNLDGTGALNAGIEVKASGSAVGSFGWTGRAEGMSPPVVDDAQEVVLRWTPLDESKGMWMLEVRRDGETISIAVGDAFVRALSKVSRDLYPKG